MMDDSACGVVDGTTELNEVGVSLLIGDGLKEGITVFVESRLVDNAEGSAVGRTVGSSV